MCSESAKLLIRKNNSVISQQAQAIGTDRASIEHHQLIPALWLFAQSTLRLLSIEQTDDGKSESAHWVRRV
jgi:hypothetical protein